jgi:WD40 repeat protein
MMMLGCSLQMWRVNSNTGQVQMLRSFGRHAAGVSSIQLHPRGGTMLTTCMDGMIVLWSMQSLEPIYKAKV